MKKILAILLSVLFVFSCSITAYADDGIETYAVTSGIGSTTLVITKSGAATVKDTFEGKSGVAEIVQVVTKIQKKVGIIWVNVSGASWTVTSTNMDYSKTHTCQLSDKGTYRAHTVFHIYTKSGDEEKLTKNFEAVYS